MPLLPTRWRCLPTGERYRPSRVPEEAELLPDEENGERHLPINRQDDTARRSEDTARPSEDTA